MLELHAAGLTAQVDALGAEVRSLRVQQRELLFQTPWRPSGAAPDNRGVDDGTWVRGWSGGWTLLFPNAGPATTVQGVHHLYHGAAALARWDVRTWADGGGSLALRLPGGLSLQRRFLLDAGRLTISTRIENLGPAPLPTITVEHLILGDAIVGPGAAVSLPAGDLIVFDRNSSAPPWRRVPQPPAMWFGAVRKARGPARVRSADGRVSLTVEWVGDDLPHLWVWLEYEHDSDEPWKRSVRCLGLEPASSLVTEGLAVAAGDQAQLPLQPGGVRTHHVTLSIVMEDA